MNDDKLPVCFDEVRASELRDFKPGTEIASISKEGNLNVLGYDINDIQKFVDIMEALITVLRKKELCK